VDGFSDVPPTPGQIIVPSIGEDSSESEDSDICSDSDDDVDMDDYNEESPRMSQYRDSDLTPKQLF